MASSRSEEFEDSIPEILYQSISMIDGNSCKKDELYVKCPLCKRRGRTFYCVECVKNGNFLHSKKKCFERFADKKVSKYKLDAKKAIILQSYEDMLSKKKQIENLKLEIYKSKEKIQLLKAGIQSCRGTISNDERMIEDLKRKNESVSTLQSRYKVHSISMEKLQKKMYLQVEDGIKRLDLSRSNLHSLIETRIEELITNIFPINQVTSQYHKNRSSEEGHYAELEEAQKTTYVSGQWVITGSAIDDVQYSIIEPCIPSNGDYFAYTNWCAEHIQGISRDSLSAHDRHQFDKAYGISAALAYTAQLVNKIAFYMDAYVPKKSSFIEFCDHESDRKMFMHKVAKLNANIVHLCLLRGVDVLKIDAHRTIENLLLLLNTKNPEPNSLTTEMQKWMEAIENAFSRDLLLIAENKDSDERKEDEEEFDIVSKDECLPFSEEASAQPVPAQKTLLPIDESDREDNSFSEMSMEYYLSVLKEVSAQSFLEKASLVSSVFSLLKAATGQR